MEKETIHLPSLLKCLVECSEKAAKIAQTCRGDRDLFQLLIQEKKEGEKNMRFVQDFKTLADVLVQETVRYDVSKKFPSLVSSILGEENNKFQNALGESVIVSISDSVEETTKLLSKVLEDRLDAAKKLAACVYSNATVELDPEVMSMKENLPSKEIGIWIDPIDSTGEYVHGDSNARGENDELASSGLKCVSVLIGAYLIQSGCPMLGVVNQPFYSLQVNNYWKSHYYWGIFYREAIATSISDARCSSGNVLVSSYESGKLTEILKNFYSLCCVTGSGYKSLAVALGYADLYILSQGSTYFWDTCGPHSILLALGGGIVNFKSALNLKNPKMEDLQSVQLKYKESAEFGNRNAGGVIAYRDPKVVIEFLNCVTESGFIC